MTARGCLGDFVTVVTGKAVARRVHYRGLLDDLEDDEEGERRAEAVRRNFPDAHYWAYELEDCEEPVAEEYMEVKG